jgi:hypothetical protein
MNLLIHHARYEIVERTEASREVIAVTSCGMPITSEVLASGIMKHVNCVSCITNKKND